ncbi:MAG: DMT family transporter [Neisseriaceae bacterium]|nr:DMT family transporter [Neisseriaceae bacterium]MBP6863328.1 DMT family transporter [Neisseriaceae bacterium]
MTPLRYQLALQTCAILYGATAIIGHQLSGSVVTTVLVRGLFAFLTLSLVLLISRKHALKPVSAANVAKLMVSGILLAVHWLCFFVSVNKGGIAISTLSFASFPAFVLLFDTLFFKERLTTTDVLVIALIALGLLLVTPAFSLSHDTTVGLLWGMASGMAYSLVVLYNRHNQTQLGAVQASWIQFLGISIALLPFGAANLGSYAINEWWLLAFLGVACTALAFTLFVYSLQGVPAKTASVVIALEPVYAIIMAWFFFAQVPTSKMVLGGLVILAAVMLSLRSVPPKPLTNPVKADSVGG